MQWDSGNGSTYSTIKTISDPSVTSLTMTNPPDSIVTGTKYRVRVFAVNSVGNGTPSVYLDIMPAALPSAPN